MKLLISWLWQTVFVGMVNVLRSLIRSFEFIVLRREDGHVLRRDLDYEVGGQRKKGRPKRTWKKQAEEESVKIVLRRKDALCCSKWSVGVNKIAAVLR